MDTRSLIYLVLMVLMLLLAPLAWRMRRRMESENQSEAIPSCGTCDGTNSRCEMDCKLEAAVTPIEYFDDEELDAFKGRPSDSYTDEEIEQFGYVFETMEQKDVADWCRSLSLRGVELPDALKDEVFLFMHHT